MYIRPLTWVLIAPFFVCLPLLAGELLPAADSDTAALLAGKALIRKLKPQQTGGNGSGYELVYLVDAPLDTFWRFKTDFDNDFLLTNKFIKSHRLISRRENIVVTEDIFSENLYPLRPNAKFRWQTTLSPARYRLDFVLLNPAECGQKFHHGHIQLDAADTSGQKTKVTQVAYFDFFGVTFWVNYPGYGGMKVFLKYTVRWEQTTISRLKSKYIQKSAH